MLQAFSDAAGRNKSDDKAPHVAQSTSVVFDDVWPSEKIRPALIIQHGMVSLDETTNFNPSLH